MKPLIPAPGVPVAFARTPYGRDVYRDVRPAGLTVAEILDSIPDLPDRFWTNGVVCLNYVRDSKAHCEPVPREWWRSVRLRECGPVPVTLTLHLPLAGGGGREGGNRKSTFALVASIALIAATTAISAGTLGPAGIGVAGGYFAAGSTSAALLSAGVGIIGGLAIAALSAPPSLKRDGEDKRDLGSASASGNVLEPGGVIPRVIGEFRASPSYAAFPLTDISGDDEIVESVHAMMGPHRWEGIRVDGVPIESDAAYSFQTREGWDDDAPLTLVTRQGFTEAIALELSEHEVSLDSQFDLKDQVVPANSLPRWHTVVTRRAPDEFWLHLLFAEGFLFADHPERVVNVPVRMRIRTRGSSTWHNLPEVHFSWRGGTAFRKAIKIKWQAAPAMPTPKDEFAPIHAFKLVPTQTGAPVGIGGWTAHSHFSAGAGNDVYSATAAVTNVRNMALYEDRVEFFLGVQAPFSAFGPFDLPGIVSEVQIMRGQPYRADQFIPATYQYAGGITDFFGYQTVLGVDQVLEDQQNGRDKIIVTRVASVWNEHPIAGPGLALLAVKARNKTVQNVSALLSAYVPSLSDPSLYVISSNPSRHYKDILTGSANADPLPVELVDQASLVDWFSRCDDDNLECNMIADGRNADELLRVIAGCGFARPRQSELWGVIQDKDRSQEAPVQIFTPRNLSGFRYEKAFPALPHGFRVRFREASRDYEEAPELIVYADGYSAANAERLEEVTYDGIITEDTAVRRAAFDLKQANLRSTFYHAEADAEALVATKGDLVGVQHDILARDAGFARVKEKYTSAGLVTGLLLDSKIPTQLGADFFSIEDLFSEDDIFSLEGTTGIAIRMKDGSGLVISQELSDPVGETDQIDFSLPFTDPGDELGEGCLIASGALGSEYLRLIVADIEPGRDLTAAITFVDEAPSLWPHTVHGAGQIDMMLALAGAADREAVAGGAVAMVLGVTGGALTVMTASGLVSMAMSVVGTAAGPISASGTIAMTIGVSGASGRGFDSSFDESFG